MQIYKTLIRPVLTYTSETWTLTKNYIRIMDGLERKILGTIIGAVNENGQWQRIYNKELYSVYRENNGHR
jgi:hypothetical protein